MSVVAAVLAAGASRRFGHPKQLVQFRGETLVARALDAARVDGVIDRAVILGAHAEQVADAAGPGVERVLNEEWEEGMASSIRCAARWAQARGAAALVVLLADQPLISSMHIARLCDGWRDGASAVGSAYEETVGVPALFDARLFPALLALTGDRGAGRLLREAERVVSVPCPEAAIDIDTPAALAELR